MYPVNRVIAPIYYPPVGEVEQAPVDGAPAMSTRELLQHPTFALTPNAANTIEQSLLDLDTLPIHQDHAAQALQIDVHVNARRAAINARLQASATFTASIARCPSPQHRAYTYAHAYGALYTRTIVEYGAALAGAAELSHLFLERLSTLNPPLERYFSIVTFWDLDDRGGPEAKHTAVLFDGTARSNARAGAPHPPPNQLHSESLDDFMCRLHAQAPRFAIIDASAEQKIWTFDARESFDTNSRKVLALLHDTGANTCSTGLRVSYALEQDIQIAYPSTLGQHYA